jgi:hypothetical protein
MVAVPHLLSVALIAGAWAIGTARGVVDNPALDVSAGLLVAISLGLAASELLRFPAPYDQALARERLWPGEERGAAPPREPPLAGVPTHARRAAHAQSTG